MQNRVPVPAGERPPLPDFAPVPRRYRHDGWTPERQKAFIEALADTGCVSRAARMVNMAQANCYALRRAAGAEGFRRAWDAALDFGLARLKDIAFERAIEGQLVPVFVAGKLIGYRRTRNDALLMFCLRHYGQDAQGRRTTINYFSSRASAGAQAGNDTGSAGAAGAVAEASTTTVRTVITGEGEDGAAREDRLADAIGSFDGVALDAEAHAAIAAALEACAARQRSVDAAIERGGDAAIDAVADEPGESFVRVPPDDLPYLGELEPVVELEEEEQSSGGDEDHWTLAGAEMPPERPRIADSAEGGAVTPMARDKR